jgi:hypothetical protein
MLPSTRFPSIRFATQEPRGLRRELPSTRFADFGVSSVERSGSAAFANVNRSRCLSSLEKILKLAIM